MKKLDIKKCYNDVLYWATSNQSKDKDYHITKVQEAVLRKLIHYSISNSKGNLNFKGKISYSNRIIAEHTFIGEESIRKAIPILNKKGYISTANLKISLEVNMITRRTIYIQWDKLELILSEVPIPEKPKEEPPSIEVGKEKTEEIPVVIEQEDEIIFGSNKEISTAPPIPTMSEGNNNEDKKAESITSNKRTQTVPKVIITNEKLKWVEKMAKRPVTKEELESLQQKELVDLFYGNGYWEINECNSENKYLIKMYHPGGSLCTLFNQNREKDFTRLNIDDLYYYLNSMDLEFGDITEELYKMIKLNGVPKRPKKQQLN
jgi:hypothetical protein